MDFQGGSQIQSKWGVAANLRPAIRFKALQTVIAHMQPAASEPMIAEKKPTWLYW